MLAAVDGVEVWNSKWIYDGGLGPHPRSLALASGKLWMAGQDVHRHKHFSRLLIETPSPDVLEDLAAGRYVFLNAGNRISVRSLAVRGAMGVAQRVRTWALRHVIRGIRAWRRLKSRARSTAARSGSRVPELGTRRGPGLSGKGVPRRGE